MQNQLEGYFHRVRDRSVTVGLVLASLAVIAWACLAIQAEPCKLAGSVACPSLAWDIEPLAVAAGFWVIGLIAGIGYGRMSAAALFMACAVALATGKLSSMASDVGGRLFYVALAWLAPLTFGFHHAMLNRPPRRLGRFLLICLYVLAALGSLPFVILPVATLETLGEFLELRFGIRLMVAISFGLGWLLLFRDYRPASRLSQQRIRLTVFGTLFGNAPLLLLSLLPDTLGAPAHVPYEWTFPWLLLAPLSYLYSLSRPGSRKAETVFNRLTVYYLVITIFLGLYLTAATLLNYLTERPSNYWPIGSAFLGVGLLLLFGPVQGLLQHLLAWILYGGEIHYTEVVRQFAEAFAVALDRDALRSLLLVEWPRVMRLPSALVFLRDSGETLSLLAIHGTLGENVAELHVPAKGTLGTYLLETPAPIVGDELIRSLALTSLDENESRLVAVGGVAYWLPLVSGGELQGLLLVGLRRDDDPFSAEDERILATMSHQAGIAAHNVRLAEEIRVARKELARAHQQLILEQDQIQRRVALDLHDQGIQQLTGILFQLHRMEREIDVLALPNGQGRVVSNLIETVRNVRDEVQALIAYLRTLTYELHPPGLEEMGLTLALQSYINHLKHRSDLPANQIAMDMERIGSLELPLPLATCLFRAAQEALLNALHHARAGKVVVRLARSPDGVKLTVRDDGQGFRVPPRLSDLTNRGHFGLVGLAERMAWAGGELNITSKPGGGTELTVQIPWKMKVDTRKDQDEAVERLERG